MIAPHVVERVQREVENAAEEAVAFACDLIRLPTVNPPGEGYETCARAIGDKLAEFRFDVEYYAAEGRPEHTAAHPRINVVGLRRGAHARPLVHLNGHFDVVPPGGGWTKDPFGGIVEDGRIYGRGACDMKCGLAAAVFAAEAIRRAGVHTTGSIEVSGTVDEESGGFAGVAWLAERKRIHASRTDAVIIPEPLNVDRICIGHRGVYWFEVTTRGRIGHGSMPFLGVSAIDHMGLLLDRIQHDLEPRLAARVTAMPVVPEAARRATINVNGISGGQPLDGVQTPCVADVCRAVFDRRFLREEGFADAKREVIALLDGLAQAVPEFHYDLRDLMVVDPVQTPEGSPLVASLERRVAEVIGRPAALVASPGTYDHKHVTRIGGIPQCVAYGPGVLDLAHQPDEWCGIDDLVNATKVLALTILDLTETR